MRVGHEDEPDLCIGSLLDFHGTSPRAMAISIAIVAICARLPAISVQCTNGIAHNQHL
jgi:hypothetical protein